MRKDEIEHADFLKVGQQNRNLFSHFSFGRLLNAFSIFDLPTNPEQIIPPKPLLFPAQQDFRSSQ